MEIKNNGSIEHQNVPEAHRGLHDFLYDSDDEHTASRVNATPSLESSTEVLPLATWRSHFANTKVAGVYAVLDTVGWTQYVGYSRNILLALNAHVALNGSESCAFVQVQIFKYPKRDEMEKLRDEWLSALDSLPPGNGEASEQWASIGETVRTAMSTEERNAYEQKKLKLRKAMADTKLINESQQDAGVENGDWSSVINEQNQQTIS